MKTYIKLMFVLAALFIGAANELCAQAIPAGNIIINGGTKSGDDYIIKDGTATAGTIAVSVSERTVTLTITPAAGYMTKKGLILAERMLNPASSAPRRAPNLANKIEGEMYTSGTTTTITSVTNPNVADYVFTVPANYDGAYVTVTFVKVETDVTFITSLDEIDITNNASGYYKLSRDIDATGNTSITGFTGTLDGNDHKIFGITNPIFSTLTGGTVKNVTFEGVNINSGDNDGDAGAVCCKANGATRIYNCGVLPTNTSYTNGEITGFTGSSVIGTRYVGSLVGFLDGEARVINCFSYANVSGGTEVGGIVGHNNVATTSAANNQKTMVMNCMFYGEVSGTSIAPIYNGAKITNDGDDNGVNNFNYFWAGASYVRNINVYNCALSAETRYLQRFEFFRHLLNSNRELAAWWVQGAGFEKKEMAKWVLEPKQIGSDVPFPILKPFGKYSSVVNIDADNATTTTERNKGGKLTSMGTNGELSVTISGATKRDDVSSLTFNLVITDKDPEHFNFNYGKVQLPYFNDYCTGNYTSTQVVTGWKITSITGGTSGSYTTDADATADSNGNITTTPYNFADRKCTNKDLYGESGSNRVFNQGAYWDVPEGVTAITIQPYWGNARYVADACLDVVYKETTIKSNNKDVIDAMSTPSPVTTIGGGARYTNGTSHKFKDIDQNEHELTVYTSISEALSEWSPSGNVYDYALVLVGNVHNIGISSGDSGKPYTIMSVDFDHDNEPDYSYILRFNNRNAVHPVRVDFLNIPGLGMAQKTTGGKGTYNLGIMNPLGWFESTNTSLFYVTQFEYDHKNRTANPYILQGGVFDQWVSGQSNGISNNTTYFHVGGNVWFKEFHRGTHQDQTYKTKHPPVSVTGGDFDEFYLTGLYRGDVANYEDNAECYINGGRFGIVAGAAMEGIGKAGGANNTGNIIWQIQNADIDEFYGGGFNAAHPIEGNITTVITGGYIKQFCGGPKFGDMNIGKTVKTTANGGCIFDTFFGAGFGGNSYSRYAPQNKNNISGDYGTSNWNTWLNGQYTQQYSTNVNYKGVATTYSTQYLPMSNNIENVARLLIDYVSFSLATTRNVTSNLTGCTINKNFYGGGNLGMVDGPVTSTLTNCTVMGNVFGAGYSAELPTVEVRNTGNFVKAPFFDEDLGAYYDPEFPGSVEYKWEHVESVTSSNAIDKNRHILRTQENLDALGVVKGKATLNIEGTTEVKGSVYGGGEESGVDNDTEIKVKGGIIGTEGQGGVEYGNVYGGGKGKRDDVTAGLVKGNTKVTISQEANQTTRIYHNVYGGGAYGSVGTFTYNGNNVITGHTANTGKTEVYITGGTFGWNGKENGMVFGSSRGDVGAPGNIEDKLAWVYDTKVYIGTYGSGSVFTTPTVMGSVYGGGENGHVYHDAEVNIYSGTVGIPTGSPITDNNGTPDDQSDDVPYSGATYPYRGNVYGAGCGTDKYYSNTTGVANLYDGNGDTYNPLAGIVQGNTTVNISGGHVVRNVYGAGAMGSVGTASDATSGKTTITVTGGRIGYDGNSNNDGNIFGAARGEYGVSTAASGLAHVRETEVNISYTTTPTADDEDKTTQLITGSVFGGGEAGTVKESVALNMTGGLVLKDIYGGGALADTQTSNWDASANSNAGGWADTNAKSTQHTTTVRATGGIVKEEIYGGALGEAGTQQNPTGKPAYVWGDVLVELNNGVADAAKGCVVGKVFGCNNANGTPKGDVVVHVYATQNAAATQIANTGGETPVTNAKRKGYYDVSAVYGGGNEAAYDPVTPNTSTTTVSNGSRTQVIIEGCDRTSIESVYGGGNAAAVPETNVDIKSAYEIYQVFGGGNGKDKKSDGSDNPGADVGTLDQGETAYGTGNANSLLEGGLIHEAYGGSNQKGIIKTSINQTTNPDGSTCNLNVEKIVGAGKYADIDGDVNMTLSCQPESKVNELFAGADEANVNGNITLNITNGHFGNVFGGNNLGGAVKGKITVNVEETGCQPIKIDNLYLGGNQAAYSVFGYYESDEVHDVTGLKILKPRTSEDDSHTPVDNPALDDTHTFPYADPELNIISCTYIGEVFGGGLGAPATMYANPSVNVNMVAGAYADTAVPAMMTELNLPNENTNHLGIIGNVYGGGDAAPVIGETHVNIGTEQTVGTSQTVLGAYITGNVYGGGKLANVGEMDADIDNITAAGRTFVNIGAKKTTENNQEEWQAVAAGKGVTIKGNVYGGGKGEATTFKCEKAMVAGSTNVMIGNGAVNGVVYGGGQLGRVEAGTTVTIGIGDGVATGTPTSEPQINGDVYGAGAGVNTHGYAALVRGISEVTIQGNAKVGRSVYGGGQIASVGRYKVKKGDKDPSDAPDDVEIGMPYTLADSNSKCIVTVKGYAEIGPDNMQMKAEGGPDDTGYVFGAGKGVLPYEGYAENEDPVRWTINDNNQYVQEVYTSDKEDLYLKYVGTLALATETEVTIGGHAFVKGSVYGGSENGHVQHNTKVKIEGNCQIGNGWNTTTNTGVNARYNENLFVNPATATAQQIETAAASIYECAHWDYGHNKGTAQNPVMEYLPYDKYVDSDEGSTTASDGHTFFGNVFGGGSGYYPYKSRLNKDNDGNYIYEWLRTAGRVEGNTNVIITGGHILTSVYGGCELTDVGNGVSVETNKGRCFVKMSGGTLGVPRTLAQIAAHPVTCYLFGAGKGDQRVHFDQWTNVGKVRVEINDSISQPIIYGSAFGGGEDGHVLGDVSIDIKTMNGKDPVIGTWGTSYVDGNVFGGGRGFGGDALTAGVVSGNVYINISGGKMLGSIYGGGRLGSVGTYLVPSTHANYGKLIDDGKKVTITDGSISETTGGGNHGHITIDISGGTIGNSYEYVIPSTADNTAVGITETDITKWTTTAGGDWDKWKSYKHIPNTEFDATSNRLTHTKGGNVFAGAMGRFYGLDGSTVLPRWIDLGKVKSTKLNISGSAVIKSSIYGGGELGWTEGTHTATIGGEEKDVSTEISISGGTIGTEVKDGEATKYTFGSVFGGGYGSSIEKLVDADSKETNPKFQAGRVKHSTKVDISGGTVRASVYGGGEVASVGYGFQSYVTDGVIGEAAIDNASDAANTYVSISGNAVIGKAMDGDTYFGGATMGNVYGGGSGNRTIVRCGLILGNTNVNVSGGTIYHNIYGGGAYGSVGNFIYTTNIDPVHGTKKVYGVESLHTPDTGTANVTITGGTIGVDGRENGMVFGSSRGDVQGNMQRDDYMAWVNEANVTIGTSGDTTPWPKIAGSVYGSGENGHTLHNTNVAIHSGTIGILTGSTITGSSGKEYNGAEYPYRGNVYGGGCGTDTYTEGGKTLYNPLAGLVKGNATVTMDGGRVARTIYGGGAMGSVGTFTYADATYHTEHTDVPLGKPYSCTEGTGLCTVTISGGSVGPDVLAMPNNYGNVFGAGRGEVHDPAKYANLETSGYVNKTLVTVSGSAFVRGSVYGGAESGHVLADTHVKIQGGQIGCGKTTTEPYGDNDNVWAADYTPTDATDLECASWPYEAPYTPYDKFADGNGKYSDGSSADNAHPTGTDGHTFYGNVFGGGSGYEPYAAGKWLPTAGWVEGNTTVEITGGHILTSVYGGNEMTDVGQGGVRKMTDLANETADMFYDVKKPGGKCTVKMSGGTLGVPRTLAQIAAHPVTCYLFGAGKGDQRIFFNKTTNVNNVEVEISGTARIYGSVFGGGEDGHVMRDVKMTIKDNAYIGNYGTSYVEGNVFGGGRGFSGEALTAGNVGGCVEINIQGGTMLGSVYGGGRLGSVGYGLYLVDEVVGEEKPYGVLRDDNVDDRGKEVSGFNRGYITINISGGTIGNNIEYKANPTAADKQKMPTTTFDSQNHLLYTRGGNVFAGCMGRLYSLGNTLLPLWPKLGRCKQTKLNITGGTIKSNVYGGAELGVVKKNTSVNITGGQVGTQIGTGSGAYYYGSVFGSGKGSVDNITYPSTTPEAEQIPISEAGTTGGNVEVHLNKGVDANAKGGIVRKVFGCNDMNGTPKGDVLVHIHATQSEGTDNIATKAASGYDVDYVFGGGNNADYVPTVSDAKQSTEVIIEGCDLTSIEEVYGGGFGAATPGTKVEVRGTKIINNLFGGGYGAGENNPGANVGIRTDGTTEYGNTGAGVKTAVVRLMAGNVHNVYGGSNTKGDIRGGSSITNIDKTGSQGKNLPCCDNLNVNNIYGGGKDAEMAGGAEIVLGCMPNDWISEIYAGAENADVGNDVSLTLTSGKFGRVFGGNKSGGKLDGKIEVNIEESETCGTPIIIGELYGGGNLAPYSIYGYNEDGSVRTEAQPNVTPHNSPRVNVRRFTSIGNIFGGGLGANAVMVGSPTVNINEVTFNKSAEGYQSNAYNPADDNTKPSWIGDGADQVKLWPHTDGQMGVIGNVFGGGNAAQVIGDTYVNIGTESAVKFESIIDNTIEGDDKRVSMPVVGADIRGNVFGGGNNAAVTGNANVNIGKKEGN